MNIEKNIINLVANMMPRSSSQINKLFESDAEILEYNGKKLLFNIDEFSEEDRIRENDPYILGWNLAVGSISDILAAGGRPVYYAHSMVINKNWSEEYIKQFSSGVAEVLKKVEASFIGGDFGSSSLWRYTAAVIGELEGKPLMRSGAREGDSIYISGKVGTGNLEAFLKIFSESEVCKKALKPFKNAFKLRLEEAKLIKKYASSCIDTSDGLCNALNAVGEMSNTGYVIKDIPYIRAGLIASRLFSMPKELLFFGECGEYELLFTVKKEDEADFVNEAVEKKQIFYRIGEVMSASNKALYNNGHELDLSDFDVRARDYDDIKLYVNKIIDFITGLG